jgi:tetratricopeptide (TPR) repeat protein
LQKKLRHSTERVLPHVVQELAAATSPFAWNAAARLLIVNMNEVDLIRAHELAERACGTLPKCCQFHVTLGVVAYRRKQYKEARDAFREAIRLLELSHLENDRESVANMRMRLFRIIENLSPGLEPSAAHIFDRLVLDSMDFVPPSARSYLPLSPLAVSSLDQYFSWFQLAAKPRMWLYLSMAESQLGNYDAAKDDLDHAESFLMVHPDIDNETLITWAQATRLLGLRK